MCASSCVELFLWQLFDRSGIDAFPHINHEHMMMAYQGQGVRNAVQEGVNPIMRKPLIVHGHETMVMTDILDDGDH